MQTAATIKMTNLETIKGAIAAKIDAANFSAWIAPLQFDVVNDTLVLGAQNAKHLSGREKILPILYEFLLPML